MSPETLANIGFVDFCPHQKINFKNTETFALKEQLKAYLKVYYPKSKNTMKKSILFIAFALTLITGVSFAQSNVVGKIDNDGNVHMLVEKSKAVEVLTQVNNGRTSQPINVSEVSFSKMSMGEICLTGYEKDANGKVISGMRIQCHQDDANNLIVKPENKIERIYGRPFASTTVVSE